MASVLPTGPTLLAPQKARTSGHVFNLPRSASGIQPKFENAAPAAVLTALLRNRRPDPLVLPARARRQMDAPAAAAASDDEWEICNDNGFVYKRRRGLYPDVAAPSSKAAVPDLEAERLRCRRRALLRRIDKRKRELAHWEALKEKLDQLPAPQPTPPQAPPTSLAPAAPSTATSASDSVLDDLLAQVEAREVILETVSGLCDELNEACRAREEDIVDSITALPIWGDPKDLMTSLQSPDEPGDLNFRNDHQDEQNGGFQNRKLDSRQSKRGTEAGGYDGCQEAAGSSSAAVQRTMKRAPSQCTEKTCRETPAKLGDDPCHSSILNENRKRKGATTPSDSKIVNKSKRFQQSTSTNPVSLSPRSTTRRAGSRRK
ncbi:hypothetical protein EJB05_20991, partial [Eragrostis curvula]